jgi:hypothetical protein
LSSAQADRSPIARRAARHRVSWACLRFMTGVLSVARIADAHFGPAVYPGRDVVRNVHETRGWSDSHSRMAPVSFPS